MSDGSKSITDLSYLQSYGRKDVKKKLGSSPHGSVVNGPERIHEDAGSIPGLALGVQDPVLLGLWCRPAAAAPIHFLTWEPPCAPSAAPKSEKKKKIVGVPGLAQGLMIWLVSVEALVPPLVWRSGLNICRC